MPFTNGALNIISLGHAGASGFRWLAHLAGCETASRASATSDQAWTSRRTGGAVDSVTASTGLLNQKLATSSHPERSTHPRSNC